ncbi:MAG: hypothetical protein WCG25_05670 [bacterium]
MKRIFSGVAIIPLVFAIICFLSLIGWRIESLVMSVISMGVLYFHIFKYPNYWFNSNLAFTERVENFRLIFALFFLVFAALFQSYVFMPELFQPNTLMFCYIIIVVACVVFTRLRFQAAFKLFAVIQMGMLLFPIVGLVTYWGTQFIWLIPAFLFPSVAALLHKQYLKTIENENLSMIVLFVALIACALSILVTIISTIIQFWGVVVWSLGGLILLIVAAVLISLYKNKKAEIKKKADLEAKQKKEAEAIAKQKKIKQEEQNKEIERMKKERLAETTKAKQELLSVVLEKGIYSLDTLYNLYYNGSENVPNEILFYLPDETMENFFNVSEVKRKISFNGAILTFILSQHKKLYDSSMSDFHLKSIYTIIQSLVSHLKPFEKMEGYDTIIKIITQTLGGNMIETLHITLE